MNIKLLAIGAVTILCGSGCAATLHPDGTISAHYWAPVVEEPVVVVDSAPVVVDSSPIVVVEQSRPTPLFPLFISYRSHGPRHYAPHRLSPAPLRPGNPGWIGHPSAGPVNHVGHPPTAKPGNHAPAKVQPNGPGKQPAQKPPSNKQGSHGSAPGKSSGVPGGSGPSHGGPLGRIGGSGGHNAGQGTHSGGHGGPGGHQAK